MKHHSLDLVFIDGDHSYDAVVDDIEAWEPKVRPGGVLGGHDFAVNFEGVIRAVTEWVAREHPDKVLHLAADCWWVVL